MAANASGNESVSYVAPNQPELCEALKTVVCSYFNYGSLKNRLDAGINPFTEELKLAVVIQELIGEPVGGAKKPEDIPVSLVLFSNEPLYVGEEKFRVMRISATYGHGAGVVGYQGIASDTILVLQSSINSEELYVLLTSAFSWFLKSSS